MRLLREEGKLHRKLLIRTRILIVIALILIGFATFNILFRDANALIALGLFGAGVMLGITVFSRMNVVQWNEEEEIVEAGRMDMLGYATLALYIAFEIGFRTVLADFFPLSATAYLLAGVAGTLLGRVFGTLIAMRRVYAATHAGARGA